MFQPGRNRPCPCGSGRKFKKCHEGSTTGTSQSKHSNNTDPAQAGTTGRSEKNNERNVETSKWNGMSVMHAKLGPSEVPVFADNVGQEIVATNYFESDMAAAGMLMLTPHQGAYRLLVPETHVSMIRQEIKTAKEVILSYGPNVVLGREAVEVMFEDNSGAPFTVQLSRAQVSPFLLPQAGATDFNVVVYGPKLVKVGTFPAKYRKAPYLPYLQKWES